MLESVAPGLARVLRRLESSAWASQIEADSVDLFEVAVRVVAAQHELPPLRRPDAGSEERPDPRSWRADGALDARARAAIGFAEQMSFDVSSIDDGQRAALFDALGKGAVPFVQAAFVADLLPRVRFALDALFGPGDWADAREETAVDLQTAFDGLIREVPALQALDPVTTEIVRVLGARRHRCRLCQSLRSRSALVAGADDALFEAIDRYPDSDLDPTLDPSAKAALGFVDALIGVPGRVDATQASSLREHFPDAACVEIVLDVMRNATNKVAVALAADAPNVESGYEIYDVGPDGELLFGLDPP